MWFASLVTHMNHPKPGQGFIHRFSNSNTTQELFSHKIKPQHLFKVYKALHHLAPIYLFHPLSILISQPSPVTPQSSQCTCYKE